MFKSENFKVIRTFLILTVLAGGLFIALSANKTSAGMIPCCSDCEAFLDACRADCFAQYHAAGKTAGMYSAGLSAVLYQLRGDLHHELLT